MSFRKAALLIGALALMQPPAAVEAGVLLIPSCGGVPSRMIVPADPPDPDQRRDCAKACHAVTDRRSKSGGVKARCS